MGERTFSVDDYRAARSKYGITHDRGVTSHAEQMAQQSGQLNPIVDPGVNPLRYSKIRLNPHDKKWIATVGCPMDIEVTCDTTGSMGGEVDTEMAVLPDLYEAVAKVLPGYDPQLCLGIFGDVCDRFVMCRPQFEMEAPKIVEYLKEMAPQRAGGDSPEDPQYAMFARAYLTDAYTNRIGLKGYHFVVTDATSHGTLERETINRVFGEKVFENELENMTQVPSAEEMIRVLKSKTHQFILLVGKAYPLDYWRELCGDKSVIVIDSTRQLPVVISAIIGLTEGTLDITDLETHLGNDVVSRRLIAQLSQIDIGAQARLRHEMPHPVPKAGDIFMNKGDTWPIQSEEESDDNSSVEAPDHIEYL